MHAQEEENKSDASDAQRSPPATSTAYEESARDIQTRQEAPRSPDFPSAPNRPAAAVATSRPHVAPFGGSQSDWSTAQTPSSDVQSSTAQTLPSDVQSSTPPPHQQAVASSIGRQAVASPIGRLASASPIDRQAAPAATTTAASTEVVVLDSETSADLSYHDKTSNDYNACAVPSDPKVQRMLLELFGGDCSSDVEPATNEPDTGGDDAKADDSASGADTATSVRSISIVPVLEDGDTNKLSGDDAVDDNNSDWDAPNDFEGELAHRDELLEPDADVEDVEDGHDDETDAILTSISGSVRVENGTLNKQALRDIGWSATTTTFEDERHEFPGIVNNVGRPTEETRRAATSPLSLFFLFFPKALWVDIAAKPNRYRH